MSSSSIIFKPNSAAYSLRRINILSHWIKNMRKYCSTSPQASSEEYTENESLNDNTELIEKKRNKSGLESEHYNILHGRVPFSEPQCEFHDTLRYHRQIFGQYGNVSGIDPSICWPTKEELEDEAEYEKVAHPNTIMEMRKIALEKERLQEERLRMRDKKVAQNLGQLEKFKKDIRDRSEQKLIQAQEQAAKKEKLMEEVRRHFGFKVDPREEKFQQMMLQREEEARKAVKKEKKMKQQQYFLEKVAALESSQEKEKMQKSKQKSEEDNSDDEK